MKTLKRAFNFAALFLILPGMLIAAPTVAITNQPAAAELQPLQGAWEGVEVGQNYRRQIVIKFTGDSLRFESSTNEWHQGNITLLPGTKPQQLRFTMTGSSTPDHVGQVVRAIFKIEDGQLTLMTLAGTESDAGEPPMNFEDKKSMRYELRKVSPQKQKAETTKAK